MTSTLNQDRLGCQRLRSRSFRSISGTRWSRAFRPSEPSSCAVSHFGSNEPPVPASLGLSLLHQAFGARRACHPTPTPGWRAPSLGCRRPHTRRYPAQTSPLCHPPRIRATPGVRRDSSVKCGSVEWKIVRPNQGDLVSLTLERGSTRYDHPHLEVCSWHVLLLSPNR